jgi:hypothetical protein
MSRCQRHKRHSRQRLNTRGEHRHFMLSTLAGDDSESHRCAVTSTNPFALQSAYLGKRRQLTYSRQVRAFTYNVRPAVQRANGFVQFARERSRANEPVVHTQSTTYYTDTALLTTAFPCDAQRARPIATTCRLRQLAHSPTQSHRQDHSSPQLLLDRQAPTTRHHRQLSHNSRHNHFVEFQK